MDNDDDGREEILGRFGSRAIGDAQVHAIEDVRTQCQSLALVILEKTPPGRERERALDFLEDASHWAVKAVAHGGQPEMPPGLSG